MTAAQFKGYYQGYVANMPVDERVSTAPEDILNAKVEDLATSVDWRTAQSPKGGPAMTPVKDQGGCGSCWAFASTATIESYYAMSTDELEERILKSPQLESALKLMRDPCSKLLKELQIYD